MADPSATLRQMILSQDEFDTAKVRALCLQITAGMRDHAEAERLTRRVLDAIAGITVAAALEMSGTTARRWREDALEAADRMIKAALG